jgi:uncharacterized protein (DUF736 family)
MGKAKTTDAAVAGTADDQEAGQLSPQLDHRLAVQTPVQLVSLIDAGTQGVLTLFPFTPREVEPGKTYPLMTGVLDTKRVKIQVSAFAKTSEEGRTFLSLSVGAPGQDHIGGALFRQEEQVEATGLWASTPGKESDRFGVIAKQVKNAALDDYETVFSLRVKGARRLSRGGVPYIKARVYPERGAVPADGQAMSGCF